MMRQVTENDLPAVHAIYMDPTVNPFMLYEIMNLTDFKPVFADMLKRDHFWLFEQNGVDAGMCSVNFGRARYAHVATLMSLGIRSEFQGKGFGRKMLSEIIEFLKANGAKRIDLMAEGDNLRAQQFYQSMGFKVDGICPKYFIRAGSDEYIDEVMMSITF